MPTARTATPMPGDGRESGLQSPTHRYDDSEHDERYGGYHRRTYSSRRSHRGARQAAIDSTSVLSSADCIRRNRLRLAAERANGR